VAHDPALFNRSVGRDRGRRGRGGLDARAAPDDPPAVGLRRARRSRAPRTWPAAAVPRRATVPAP